MNWSSMKVDTSRSHEPGRSTRTEMRERQSAKIRELKVALNYVWNFYTRRTSRGAWAQSKHSLEYS